MGNQLTTTVPSQIWPVEQYLNDLSDFDFVENLGSTRFFKVAKSRSKEGLVVIKVFVLPDPAILLESYKEQVWNIQSCLSLSFNCLPYQRIFQSDKAIMLFRQYIQYSLYDRLSTHPFLCSIEKKWIAFLLLTAINQCHKLNIYHGDIKSENVMITSWNWVSLTDFASYKPVYLPDNNPTEFSFYFDTSRRRTCYIAPERFDDDGPSDEMLTDPVETTLESTKTDELLPSMDIFSTGCVLIELFSDGAKPFDLSQLLSYRSGDYYPRESIDLIDDAEIKKLVEHMIQKDPSLRLSADEYLKMFKRKIFPDCFYTFLQPYCQRFACYPLLYADERILRLHRDIDLIKQKLVVETDKNSDLNIISDSNIIENLLIILSVVTSSIQKLVLSNSKLIALNLLKLFSNHLPSEIILDRILPYVLFFVHDNFFLVKCETIRTLVHCLSKVRFVPPDNISIFTDYIFLSTNYLLTDKESAVRIEFAKNIACIAELAVRFLELIQLHSNKKTSVNQQKHKLTSELHDFSAQKVSSYDSELTTLHDVIQQNVVSLLGDKENNVKKALLENGIIKLCIFFGRKRANDVLFSHMITFLNDKQDWQLRELFFDNMVGVAAYLGWQCSSILKPLIQQGISDPEEFVVIKTISSFCCLIKLNLMPKKVLIDLFHETICLVLHPNIWIQRKVIGLIGVVAEKMELSDVYSYVIPLVSKYFTNYFYQSDELVLIESVNAPLSRPLYQQLLKCPYPWEKMVKRDGMSTEKFNGYVNLLTHPVSSNKRQVPQYSSSEQRYKEFSDMTEVTKTKLTRGNRHVNSRMNEDWKQMFNPVETFDGGLNKPLEPIEATEKGEQNQFIPAHLELENLKAHNSKQIVAWCKNNIDDIQTYYKTHCESKKYFVDSNEGALLDEKKKYLDWKPQGYMVAHLHEHRGAINRIRVCQKNPLLASCSNDGCVKVWDSSRLDGKSITNRSKLTYSKLSGQIKSICFAQNSSNIIATSDNGMMHVFKIDLSSRPNAILTKDLDASKNGLVVDMMPTDHLSENVIALATVHGLMFGWDLRTPQKHVWQVQTDPKYGLITSFDVNKKSNWIVCGTNSGNHSCWDLRFLLSVNNITHPNPSGTRVKRLIVDESSPSLILSSSYGNNELLFWDVETGARQKVLWASPKAILTYENPTKHFFSGIYATSSYVITAGSDMRIRYWNLNSPSESFIVAGSSGDSKDVNSLVSYNTRLVEATQAIYESYHKQPPSSTFDEESHIKPYVPVGHRDVITDLTVCSSTQHYIITSSRDGIIKVWK
ncbi:hypothetical protein HELRODRAFT_187533 [Helobdella robusta]|uniref:non-specific serine/threonine protein kinase n=1 Tax=Helobdella robusta TaxID=6412 RepID=T1FPA4_HELRO|nr:hypothetical protein HELRODRAFT_187533 [Helobdella robusta]ESN93225.1 hypothetical protein HELRODRAFT_187533 [Helobdella robusta]